MKICFWLCLSFSTHFAIGQNESHHDDVTIILFGELTGNVNCTHTTEHFALIRETITAADYAAIQLGTAFQENKMHQPSTDFCHGDLAEMLHQNGFDLVLAANNQMYQQTADDFGRLNAYLALSNLKMTGLFENETRRRLNSPLLLRSKGSRFAVLNYNADMFPQTGLDSLHFNFLNEKGLLKNLKKASYEKPALSWVHVNWPDHFQGNSTAIRAFSDLAFENKCGVFTGNHDIKNLSTSLSSSVFGGTKLSHLSVSSLGAIDLSKSGSGSIALKVSFNSTEPGSIKKIEYGLLWSDTTTEGTFIILPVLDYEQSNLRLLPKDNYKRMKEFASSARKEMSQVAQEVLLSSADEIAGLKPAEKAGEPATRTDTSSSRNEAKTESNDEIVYYIQIAASKDRSLLGNTDGPLFDTYQVIESDGLYRHYLGESTDLNEIRALLIKVRSEVSKDAFIVAMKDGVRVSIPSK